jgi:hypothetical protein
MGLPVTERGGPPGGGGIGRPVALLGAWAGAEGGGVGATGPLVADGADPDGAAGGGTAGGGGAAGGAGVVAGADAAGADAAGAAGAGAAGAGAAGAGADAAGTAGAGGGERTEPVGGEDLTVVAAGARRGEGALGCSDAGRLVINLVPERLGGIGAGGLGVVSLPVLPPPVVVSGSSPPPETGGLVVSMVAGAVSSLAAAFLAVATFLSEGAAGSSGWTGRRSPSLSALRRARSACASSMDDEWLLTPIPRDRHRSSASLLVSPSS